jgi:ribosome biogenesis protein UTP30
LKASKALLAHIKKASKQKADQSEKRNLLDDDEDPSTTPIWLNLTTKRHIVDKARLQPGKISLPHSLNNDETTICLITAEPQRAYKDIVASEDFPAELGKRITRVIDYGKLKAKYSQYEAQRKLFAEADIFLGDDRIINRLPKILGKTFYKTTQKRPVPVNLQAKAPKVDGKRQKRVKAEGTVNAGTPAEIAKEVQKAINSAFVSLNPSTNTSIRIGYSGWTAEQIAENVDAVVTGMIEKWIPQKWRNMKSIYIKGPETTALPIWLTDELWVDEKDVIAEDEAAKALKGEKPNIGKKRKSLDNTDETETPAPTKKAKKQKQLPEADDGKLDKQISDRKARLRKQKASASKAIDN